MNTKHKFQGLAVGVLILAAATTAFALPDAGNRGDNAWSDRLNQQAAYEQEQLRIERANAAYAARYAGQTETFENLIREAKAARLERANKAWSDRLTGMAEAEAAK